MCGRGGDSRINRTTAKVVADGNKITIDCGNIVMSVCSLGGGEGSRGNKRRRGMEGGRRKGATDGGRGRSRGMNIGRGWEEGRGNNRGREGEEGGKEMNDFSERSWLIVTAIVLGKRTATQQQNLKGCQVNFLS